MRILLIRSRHIAWTSLRATLEQLEGTRVVGDLSGGPSVPKAALDSQPDVVIAAPDLPHGMLADLMAALRQGRPDTHFVLIGESMEHDALVEMENAGIDGYLRWSEVSPEMVRACLMSVELGLHVGSPSEVEELVRAPERRRREREEALRLTERDRDVLKGLLEGLTQVEIGHRENVSRRTVQRTIQRLEEKLGVDTLAGLVKATRDLY